MAHGAPGGGGDGRSAVEAKGESAAVERRVEAAAEAEGEPAVMRSAAAGALFGGGGSNGSRLPTSSRYRGWWTPRRVSSAERDGTKTANASPMASATQHRASSDARRRSAPAPFSWFGLRRPLAPPLRLFTGETFSAAVLPPSSMSRRSVWTMREAGRRSCSVAVSRPMRATAATRTVTGAAAVSLSRSSAGMTAYSWASNSWP